MPLTAALNRSNSALPWRWIGVSLLMWLMAVSTFAQDADNPLPAWEARLAELEMRLELPELDEVMAAKVLAGAITIRGEATNCVADREIEIEQMQADLDLIGFDDPIETDEAVSGENDISDVEIQEQADEIHMRRLAMESAITQARIRLQECRFIILRADKLDSAAETRQQALSAERLGSQGVNLFTGLREIGGDMGLTGALVAEAIEADRQRSRLTKSRLFKLIALTIAGALLGIFLGRMMMRWSQSQRGRGGEATIMMVLTRNLNNLLPLFLAGLVSSVILLLYTSPDPLSSLAFRVALATLLLAVGMILSRWFTGPFSPGADWLITPELSPLVYRRMLFLIVSVLITFTFFGRAFFDQSIPTLLIALRAVCVLLIVTSIIWLTLSAHKVPDLRGRMRPLRLLLVLAALAAVTAEFSGFRNLANHLLGAMLSSIAALLALWTSLWVLRTAIKGVTDGTSRLSYQMRNWFGMRPGEKRSEFGWLRLIAGFGLWLLFFAALINAWDPNGSVLPKILTQIGQGIPLGANNSLILKDVLIGFVTFGIIVALTAGVKARLSTHWLRDTGMDRGSREAIVTLSGYVGFVFAAILGMTAAGVDFKGLVWLVTALSVGIGFGLQNIVSNFVSGLILLFERPIKSGDYVSVGTVEGIVKQIRIRSTEIETLNRQTVIVPNSELVASQVTNWVLHDPHGRLSLVVGVAYGSDTELVKETLERVARDHSEVLSKGPTPPPRALFTGFGDSSLDFELRVWIRQIERRFGVTSDLNFAIDKAFREASIEIPFPQRDLHVRSWSPDISIAEEDSDEGGDPPAANGASKIEPDDKDDK